MLQFSAEVEASGDRKYMARLKQRLRELSATDNDRFQEEGLKEFIDEIEDVSPGEWHLRVSPKFPEILLPFATHFSAQHDDDFPSRHSQVFSSVNLPWSTLWCWKSEMGVGGGVIQELSPLPKRDCAH